MRGRVALARMVNEIIKVYLNLYLLELNCNTPNSLGMPTFSPKILNPLFMSRIGGDLLA